MVLLSLNSWNPAYGGPFFSVGNLARALIKKDVGCAIMFAGDFSHLPAHEPINGIPLHLVSGKRIPVLRQTRMQNLSADLSEVIEKRAVKVIHDNGLWTSMNHGVATVANRKEIPRLHSPRGTLDPWSMSFRRWKKVFAWHLYQHADLKRASVLHAASKREAEQIRNLGFEQPIALIPNGVDLTEKTARFESKSRKALYLGRIHPVKNLETLVRAWAQGAALDWILEIVGSNENQYREKLEALSASLGVAQRVHFREPCYGEEKTRVLAQAQLLFMVSHSENFGLSAAEGAAAGLPVIASKETPWEGLLERDAGWWVEGSIEPLAEVIRKATNRTPKTLQEMGARGQEWMCEEFAWPVIAQKFQSTYRWMSEGGSAPECFQFC